MLFVFSLRKAPSRRAVSVDRRLIVKNASHNGRMLLVHEATM
jgi:hypothetical protein